MSLSEFLRGKQKEKINPQNTQVYTAESTVTSHWHEANLNEPTTAVRDERGNILVQDGTHRAVKAKKTKRSFWAVITGSYKGDLAHSQHTPLEDVKEIN